ncbi:hypothetical protein [Virgisporangium aliadipatigenens]|nr:hypothetical protein [Virgisporangium aliadipatigenens]
MELTPFVERVRQELLAAADAAGPEGRALAERLVAPLDSALRLVLLAALSTASDEITGDLAPGSVEVRLRGTDPAFVVTRPPADDFGAMVAPSMAPSMAAVPAVEEEGTTARINFRPPEHLKARIEEAAARDGLSVNAWLVRATSGVLGTPDNRKRPSSGQSFSGWVS